MDLFAEIDRGDVWYDLPFDPSGGRLPQPRERFPTFTLYVKWRGERVPLVRWRTTIGGWRAELAADGQEYYRYKGSDVGPRVWRHIVAAPVWIPPPSSPLGSMVKEKRVNGTYARVTNYDETGPGYLSAYGLVAAIHEEMRKGPDGLRFFDNGIRTHGSFDYTSLRGRFSHGCHRLDNQLAMRLFSFVLAHRQARAVGLAPLSFRRPFVSKGEVFEMRLPNRGFYYQLDPPLPVDVLEGRIKGTAQKPMAGYVRKPGVKYASHACPHRRRFAREPGGWRGAVTASRAPASCRCSRSSASPWRSARADGRRPRRRPRNRWRPPPATWARPLAEPQRRSAGGGAPGTRRRARPSRSSWWLTPAARLTSTGDARISASRRSKSRARAAADHSTSWWSPRGRCRCTHASSPTAVKRSPCVSTATRKRVGCSAGQRQNPPKNEPVDKKLRR